MQECIFLIPYLYKSCVKARHQLLYLTQIKVANGKLVLPALIM